MLDDKNIETLHFCTFSKVFQASKSHKKEMMKGILRQV